MQFINDSKYDGGSVYALNLAASRTVQKTSFFAMRVLYGAVGVMFFAFALYATLKSGVNREQALSMAAVMLALTGIMAYHIVFIVKVLSKRTWKKHRNKVIEQHFEFDDTVLRVTNVYGEKEYPYENFIVLCQTDEYFILFADSVSAHVLRKNGFTQGDSGAFESFILEKTGKDEILNLDEKKKSSK